MCESRMCNGCPFNDNEESENVNNSGCLPEPKQILNMKVNGDIDWKCHSKDIICMGLVETLTSDNFVSKINRIMYKTEKQPKFKKSPFMVDEDTVADFMFDLERPFSELVQKIKVGE